MRSLQKALANPLPNFVGRKIAVGTQTYMGKSHFSFSSKIKSGILKRLRRNAPLLSFCTYHGTLVYCTEYGNLTRLPSAPDFVVLFPKIPPRVFIVLETKEPIPPLARHS